MSGNLFQQGKYRATPIKSEVATLLQQLVIKELLDNYPDMEYCCIGSIGKKKDGEYNGDIDIAIKTDTIEELEAMITKVFSYTESVTSKSYFIVSILYPYKDPLDDDNLKFASGPGFQPLSSFSRALPAATANRSAWAFLPFLLLL